MVMHMWLHRRLTLRAALAGMLLSDYLLGEIRSPSGQRLMSSGRACDAACTRQLRQLPRTQRGMKSVCDDAFLGTSEGWIALANGVVGDGRESALGDSQHDLAPMGSPGAFPATALAERLF
jgi:hypothetical protein